MRVLPTLVCTVTFGICRAATSNAAAALSQDAPVSGPLSTIVITATRIPETADRVPAAISVISGSELRARGASDMATALSLVPGVEAPAGGDAGPSSAVPSFWGLHEFDAFLLVVDGVPWGGAFNPAITTLDFTDTQRVEVLKGAAPVMYGATSFVGVVNAHALPGGRGRRRSRPRRAAPTARCAGPPPWYCRGSVATGSPSPSMARTWDSRTGVKASPTDAPYTGARWMWGRHLAHRCGRDCRSRQRRRAR